MCTLFYFYRIMKNVLLLLIIFFFFIFSLCNNLYNKKYTSSNYVNDITTIKESNKVSYADIELLTKYITLSKITGNDLEGKTYEEILGRIKDIRQTNTDANDRKQMERDAMRERMSS